MDQENIYIENIEYNNNKFIKLTNSLGGKLSKDYLSFFEFQYFFKEIAHYSARQFLNEKDLMVLKKIDKEFYDRFISHQKSFIKEISVICENIKDDTTNAIFLLNTMILWIDEHIFKRQKELFDQISLINSGKSSKEAYEIIKNSDKNSVSLVKSLNQMLDVILSRNKELEEENNRLEKLIYKKNQEIAYIKDKYKDIFSIDPITNLPNRSEAIKHLNSLLNSNRKFSVMMIKYNEYSDILKTNGIRTAKEALKIMADIFQLNIRSDDKVYVLSTGEFLIICPDANESNIINIANKFLSKVENNPELLLRTEDINTISVCILNCLKMNDAKEILKICDKKIRDADSKEKSVVII